MEERKLISIVIPVYNEAAVLPELYKRLINVIASINYNFEIIFVDDGSKDESWNLISSIYSHNREGIRAISFSRNFGHQVAITAALDYSQGQAVIVMDADLQDPPEMIPSLIEKWQEGYDVVYAVRTERPGEGAFKRGTAAFFYRLLRRLARIDIPADAGDFRLMSRRAVEALKTLRERHRFVRGLSSWIGFRQTAVSYVRDIRYAGETKYRLVKMVKFALDGITSFSFAPLQLATYLGFGASVASFCYILYAVGLKLFTDKPVLGWASLMVAVLFIGGVQLITLGIIGEYIGRIYEEIKQRPLYIVADAIGFSAEPRGDQIGSDGQRQPGKEA